MQQLCDENCNECSVINSANFKQIYRMLAFADQEYGRDFLALVNDNCCNATVCPECHVDDFCHVEGCSIGVQI